MWFAQGQNPSRMSLILPEWTPSLPANFLSNPRFKLLLQHLPF
ncbi:hypothetical protein SynSYN20_02442 [Synechococcus sp. SYN20]|nr:hypothetical protein SynMVIR181_02170 [Synechococcus sp. MVIR-18-1]QNJ26759.1 hypothetical protein SynSYN20_02442 [Synechococcus sp. SYN20]